MLYVDVDQNDESVSLLKLSRVGAFPYTGLLPECQHAPTKKDDTGSRTVLSSR